MSPVRRADELQPGQRVMGRAGHLPFAVGTLTVDRLAPAQLRGQDTGISVHWRENIVTTAVPADALFTVEDAEP